MASNGNNIVDNILDTQKKVLDNVVESTKKFTTGNPILNETIEKGTDWYKNWMDSQKTLFTKAAGFATGSAENTDHKAETASENGNANKGAEFLEQWMSTQANWAKQIWEMSQEAAKKFGANATNPFANMTGNTANPFAFWTNQGTNPFTSWTNTHSNPFAEWQNAFSGANNNPMAAWMNQMNTNNWMNQMQNMNPMNNDQFKKASENVTNLFNQYYSTLNSNFAEWQKSFENGTVQDAYKNMINTGEGFTKFAEMWMPMIKSMQEKNFNMDEYKKMMNPETYKEFMDKFFGFMPESSREFVNKLTASYNDTMKQAGDAGMKGYNQMREMMQKNMGNNGSQIFGNIQSTYGNWQKQMNEAFAPFTKMMTPNQQTKAMQDWNGISDRIMAYNLKNAELQYMVYTQGAKVMDKLAENMAKKMQEGKEVSSIVDLYQEWMNISDKVYVSLFESTEYSELMAEVGAMQMKLKKDIELQTEKMLKDIPVATRSELDEVYKTIYDLKKQVRQLEKMLDLDVEETEETPEATEAKKTAKKSAAKK
jgi:polyhydroxyalkanoate synthesis regulator phasin